MDEVKDVHIVFVIIQKPLTETSIKVFYAHKRTHEYLLGSLNGLWIKLADHYQSVFIHWEKSGTGLIKTGVPHGANLGPLLFVIIVTRLLV